MFINKIKSEGILKYTYDERKQMSLINFDNITKKTALNYANSMCSRISKIDNEDEISDILWRPYSNEIYNPEEIMKRLHMLTPDKSIVTLISKIVE